MTSTAVEIKPFPRWPGGAHCRLVGGTRRPAGGRRCARL